MCISNNNSKLLFLNQIALIANSLVSILNLTSQTTQAVADGNWLFLKPLHAGIYELKAKGDINATSTIEINGNQYNGPIGWNYTTTYILNVKRAKN
jgi:hypothetical protein